MNIYDTANKLATEIKQSEEYLNLKKAKELLNEKPELKQKIKEFEEARYEAQIETLKTGKKDEEKNKKMQEIYMQIIQIEEIKNYFEVELKFNVILTDVNKIIGEAVREVIR